MPRYSYRAVTAAGDVSSGELEAANESEIVDRLRDQGLLPMQIAESLGGAASSSQATRPARQSLFAPKRVTRDNVLALTRDLATLLRAGLTLDRALELLISLATSQPVAAMLQGVRDEVRGGKSLSQALDARRDVFSRFYVNIVRAGEAGGALGTVLARLAETMERNKELRDSVRSALIYPTILIFVAVASIMILLIYVVPQFQTTFAQAGKALPIPTQVVIAIGTFLRNWWWAVIPGIALAIAWFRRRGQIPSVRRARDTRLLGLPLVGDLIAKVEIARFARTLSTLLANGVTLLTGLGIVKETMGNVVLASGFDGVIAKLREGKGFGRPMAETGLYPRLATQMILVGEETMGNVVLASGFDGVIAKLREGKGFGRPMAETGLYPRLATQMILVGEESGRLEEMLTRVADVYDREVATAIKRFLAVLEPVLILGLAVMVGGIVFSILLGVMGMSELVV